MSPAFEGFLARLYVDGDARARFLADAAAETARAGLAADERAALIAIDRVGLALAAASFARKRARKGRGRPPSQRLGSWLAYLARLWS